MGYQNMSIMHLLNKIRQGSITLPDLQRDFVWEPEQIRFLFNSIMRHYPFGSLLLWETRFLSVSCRPFVANYKNGAPVSLTEKPEDQSMLMVLDGQQRLQSLYIGIYGSHEGKSLYLDCSANFTSLIDENSLEESAKSAFEFRKSSDPSKPKTLIKISDIASWPEKYLDDNIEKFAQEAMIEGDALRLAKKNINSFYRIINVSDFISVYTLDENAQNKEQALPLEEVLEIFVRINSGGTKLSKSDLMFSFLKTKWPEARDEFDQLLLGCNKKFDIDKDFVIRGLQMISGVRLPFELSIIQNAWERMKGNIDLLSQSLRSTIDFVESPDMLVHSDSLLRPTASLFPIIFYLSRQENCSIQNSQQRQALRTFLYFLLFNKFVQGPGAVSRLHELRSIISASPVSLPLDQLLEYMKGKRSIVQTSVELLNEQQKLALSIVQPGVYRETLSYQERPELDHIFPQSKYRERFPDLYDDIGNKAFLGKLRNIQKTNAPPWEYFENIPAGELDQFFCIDKSKLRDELFTEFVASRRERIKNVVATFLRR